jgi:hypothetical protein
MFVTSLLAPKLMMMSSAANDNKDDDDDDNPLLWKRVIDRMQEKMDDNNNIQLFAAKLLSLELTKRLHAERSSCTERVYHYLLRRDIDRGEWDPAVGLTAVLPVVFSCARRFQYWKNVCQ